ncbi:hypothetical protein AB1Y20_009429 [Prymnesium parvum]|uniref:N-carbamoyl-L-amino-acid hydrolase n=1 Tax=Prymnesium parvum TaxID=97485 RepID=A0AB34K0P2_PRYPA
MLVWAHLAAAQTDRTERHLSVEAIVALTDTSRVLADIRALSHFGRGATAISRPALSPADLEARRYVASRMEAAGLHGVQLDGMGTVYGSAGVENAPALLMGSHTDTAAADPLDGALGVAYALEAARVLREGGAADLTAWSVVSWQDRAGRFGALGASSAFVSPVFTPTKELWRARGEAGLAGVPVMHASGRHGGWAGFLEAHVERGSRLAPANATLGVVGAVPGQQEIRVVCASGARQADVTPMAERRDAMLEAMRVASAVDDGLRALCVAWEEGVLSRGSTCSHIRGCAATWSVGDFSVGASLAMIPHEANLTVQLRSPQQGLLERMARYVTRTVGSLAARADGRSAPKCTSHEAMAITAECLHRSAVHTVGEERVIRLDASELHDAAPLSKHMAAGMLLVPCTTDSLLSEKNAADVAAGAEAYVRAAVYLALGECDTSMGPTCIVGDARRNVRLSDPSWIDALSLDAENVASVVQSDDPDDYPDL